jgi:quinoprotein relay system zinc metallohydrolase 1
MSVRSFVPFIVCALMITPVRAEKDYGLVPQKIARDTYVLLGRNEHFNFRNGGNIVNTAFIVTTEGVVVIDTGPSRLYGEQLRRAIKRATNLPIFKIYNTHLHPDHFLGNQAFEDTPIAALADTVKGMQAQGEQFSDNMYRLAGAWMSGTRLVLPTETVKPGIVDVGDHTLRLLALDGHSAADLVLLDETTGVLFAGDIVFHDRTPTTPHADAPRWLIALDKLASVKFNVMVPGHGNVATGPEPIAQTRGYLEWLTATLTNAAEAGRTMAEVLEPDAPQSVTKLAVFPEEYQRSVAHLFPAIESRVLSLGRVEQD